MHAFFVYGPFRLTFAVLITCLPLTFDPYQFALPIEEVIESVQNYLQQHNTLIVHAPPGAGKSTLLPLALLDQPWLQGQKIILLEPRRLAAKSIAARMSNMYGTPLGDTIGYRIRFESNVGAVTQIEVVTEGILTRMLHSDNALEGVGMVIFDEFHERSIHADVALALCRETQQVLRPELRIMIMSATLNTAVLSKLLQAPVIESEGKMFPVEHVYAGGQDERLLPEVTSRLVLKAMKEHEGDVLVFLPGEGEIRKCADLLKPEVSGVSIHPLYGMLSFGEQQQAIRPHPQGKRKIVLATSIAETSLTIEGIRIVVDTGFARMQRFDPKSGLSRLETVAISKDAADQRAGRAGRLSAGVCYRMWTKATHDRLLDHRIPEIMEADLASLMLDLAVWGVHDLFGLTWLTPPPKAHVKQANEVLHMLGALENNRITEHGKQVHQLACHPRIAHMLLMAQTVSAKQLATDIAAILEERDPLPRDSGIDINLRIEALRRSRQHASAGNRMARIEKVAESYRRLLAIQASNDPVDVYETGLLLAYAYPERIACARPGNNAQFQLANGKYAVAGHRDDLSNEPWLSVAHIDTRDGLGKIFLASPLNPKDLRPLVKEKEVITWDTHRGGLIASKDLRIGSIVLQSKPLPDPDPKHLVEAIAKAVETEGERLLNMDEAFVQLQCRIRSLQLWNEDDQWPDVSTASLLATNLEWLGGYYAAVKRNEDLKKINLAEALLHSLNWEQQQLLEQLAPAKINVPSGSMIPVEYAIDGGIPVLSVRLQEVFGMLETPKVNKGTMPVVMHLLSPGFKPIQVTRDLKSFWQLAYFEVKSELKRRYPKHAWPDNPLEALPVAKGGIRR